MRGLKALGRVLAEEVVAVHQDHALRRGAGVLEDLREVLDGLAAERGARGKVPIHVLELLLSVLHGLGHVGSDGVGGGNVDQEGHVPLLGDRDHGRSAAGVERSHQHLGALVDDPLGLRASHVGLGLGVAEQ
jgi:hypothetical protein